MPFFTNRMKPHEALKHYFIPHVGNDYKPHFFREISITVFLVAIIVLFATSAGTSFVIKKTDLGAAVLPAVLVDLTNDSRTANGELALAKSVLLEQAATLKAGDMSSKSYFAHVSPEGVTPWHWFSQAGYNFIYAGENLAVDFSESTDVQNAWLASPTHRANILNGKFTEIGIATKEGTYKGHPTIFVVQEFGKPLTFDFPAGTGPTTTKTTPASPVVVPVPVASAAGAEVRGATVTQNQLEVIAQNTTDTNTFVAVKNVAAAEAADQAPTTNEIPQATPPVHYASWYDRFLVFGPNYTNLLFMILMGIVFVALVIMVVLEFKKQHPKNIMYGVLILLVLISLAYINQSVFVWHFMI